MADELRPEVKAIDAMLSSLKDLEPEAQVNVVEFVIKVLKLKVSIVGIGNMGSPVVQRLQSMVVDAPSSQTHTERADVVDIRTLAESKNPSTVSEKVALMAYYLANLAKADERRDYITAEDIKPYFKQANFELPKAVSMALTNAKNAGYLVAIGNGQFRLNSVGHNLIAHKLPKSKK